MISLASEDKASYCKKKKKVCFLTTWNDAQQLQIAGTFHSSTATRVETRLVYLFLHNLSHA